MTGFCELLLRLVHAGARLAIENGELIVFASERSSPPRAEIGDYADELVALREQSEEPPTAVVPIVELVTRDALERLAARLVPGYQLTPGSRPRAARCVGAQRTDADRKPPRMAIAREGAAPRRPHERATGRGRS